MDATGASPRAAHPTDFEIVATIRALGGADALLPEGPLGDHVRACPACDRRVGTLRAFETARPNRIALGPRTRRRPVLRLVLAVAAVLGLVLLFLRLAR